MFNFGVKRGLYSHKKEPVFMFLLCISSNNFIVIYKDINLFDRWWCWKVFWVINVPLIYFNYKLLRWIYWFYDRGENNLILGFFSFKEEQCIAQQNQNDWEKSKSDEVDHANIGVQGVDVHDVEQWGTKSHYCLKWCNYSKYLKLWYTS